MASKPSLLKVVLLGDGGVGKSSLMNRFVSDKFDSQSFHTIGVEFLNKDVSVEGGKFAQAWKLALQIFTRNLTVFQNVKAKNSVCNRILVMFTWFHYLNIQQIMHPIMHHCNILFYGYLRISSTTNILVKSGITLSILCMSICASCVFAMVHSVYSVFNNVLDHALLSKIINTSSQTHLNDSFLGQDHCNK